MEATLNTESVDLKSFYPTDLYEYSSDLTEGEIAVLKELRESLEKNARPTLIEYTEKAEFPFHAWNELTKVRFMDDPRLFEGRDNDLKPSELYNVFRYFELAKMDPSFATLYTVHGGLFYATLLYGGTESMSQSPYVLKDARWGKRMGDSKIVDTMLKDGLMDAFNDIHMGVTAENIVEEYGFTREQQDELAVRSQNNAEKAIQSGRFKDEIVPVEVPQRKGDPKIVDTDEHPRFGTTMEGMSKLKPAFKKDGGSVTAGNSSGLNDGAAAIIIMSREKAEELGLEPLATIKSYASAGVEPRIMGCGPIPATQKALEKANLKPSDLDLIEANEAFAAQALSVITDLDFNTDIVNVNGGAIALGHPIGASGARVLVTLLHEMKKRDSKYGLATLCIGGGQGISLIVER